MGEGREGALSIKGELTILGIPKAWKPMTEEPESKKETPPAKLLIDNLSDFQFQAAYLAYSNAYDKATSPEAKKQLNENITALQQSQIDYSTFYRNISQYRENVSSPVYGRAIIKTQRKRDWRRSAEKQERNKRHNR